MIWNIRMVLLRWPSALMAIMLQQGAKMDSSECGEFPMVNCQKRRLSTTVRFGV